MKKELKGIVANRGVARGIARIVSGPEDFDKFEKGNILVAKITDPSYVLIITRAAAIVTDLGGVTSHPAIIAREFNIPCIVGTEVATQIIKNGALIQVDASSGVVKIIN